MSFGGPSTPRSPSTSGGPAAIMWSSSSRTPPPMRPSPSKWSSSPSTPRTLMQRVVYMSERQKICLLVPFSLYMCYSIYCDLLVYFAPRALPFAPEMNHQNAKQQRNKFLGPDLWSIATITFNPATPNVVKLSDNFGKGDFDTLVSSHGRRVRGANVGNFGLESDTTTGPNGLSLFPDAERPVDPNNPFDKKVQKPHSLPKGCDWDSWQTTVHPTCNNIHMMPMVDLVVEDSVQAPGLPSFSFGGSRLTGKYRVADGSLLAFKTLRPEMNFNEREQQKAMVELIAHEQYSPAAVGVFEHCAASFVTEFADGGVLPEHMERTVARQCNTDEIRSCQTECISGPEANECRGDADCERACLFECCYGRAGLNLTSTLASNTVSADDLRLAIDLASIVAHLHEHHSTPLVHRDLDPANVVFVDGQVKMIDFNEGQLIPRLLNNITASSNMPAPVPCYPHGIPVGSNIDDKPLEIIHRDVVTEKVDVYQLGALFFFILTRGARAYHCENPKGRCTWGDRHQNSIPDEQVRQMKVEGQLPSLPKYISESEDEFVRAVVYNMEAAMHHDVSQRPTAKSIMENLVASLNAKSHDDKAQGRIDFFVAGIHRSIVAPLVESLSAHKEIDIPRHEQCFSDEARYVSSSVDKNNKKGLLRGGNCPVLVKNPDQIEKLAKKHGMERIIVGLRHPVFFYEHLFNYRVANCHANCGPKILEEQSTSLESLVLVSQRNRFEEMSTESVMFDQMLGFMPFLEERNATAPSLKLFIYTAEQLNGDSSQIFKDDLKDFLSLSQPIFSDPIDSFDMSVEAIEWNGRYSMDICQEKYTGLRNRLMKRSKGTASFLLEKFIFEKNVKVGDIEHFKALVSKWSKDPCLMRSYRLQKQWSGSAYGFNSRVETFDWHLIDFSRDGLCGGYKCFFRGNSDEIGYLISRNVKRDKDLDLSGEIHDTWLMAQYLQGVFGLRNTLVAPPKWIAASKDSMLFLNSTLMEFTQISGRWESRDIGWAYRSGRDVILQKVRIVPDDAQLIKSGLFEQCNSILDGLLKSSPDKTKFLETLSKDMQLALAALRIEPLLSIDFQVMVDIFGNVYHVDLDRVLSNSEIYQEEFLIHREYRHVFRVFEIIDHWIRQNSSPRSKAGIDLGRKAMPSTFPQGFKPRNYHKLLWESEEKGTLSDGSGLVDTSIAASCSTMKHVETMYRKSGWYQGIVDPLAHSMVADFMQRIKANCGINETEQNEDRNALEKNDTAKEATLAMHSDFMIEEKFRFYPLLPGWIHLEWHPMHRRDRFPSVDERVRLYMSNWYLPPCNSSSQFAYKIDPSSESHHYATVSIKQPQLDRIERSNRLVQVSSDFILEQVINIQNKTILHCDGENSYCQDLVHDAAILGIGTIGLPMLACLGDAKPDEVMLNLDLRAPLLSKYRGATPKKELFDVTNSLSSDEKCFDSKRRKRLIYNAGYQNELDILSATKKKTLPFAPIIWKFNTARHFGKELEIARDPLISWEDKIPKAIWRGTISGRHRATKDDRRNTEIACQHIPRCDFVKRHNNSKNMIDAGFHFHSLKNEINKWADEKGLTKDKMTIEEQLQYKILICLEGNDVSSGLKWMLLSNSIVLMPPPTRTSWAMEELLEPYVHYVPMAEDGSDAEEKVQWILDNDMEAQRIAERATLFMEDMLYHPDAKRDELEVKKEIVRRYREHWRPMPDSEHTDITLSPGDAFVPSSSPTPRITWLSLEDRDRGEIGGVGVDIIASPRQMNAADPTPAPTLITNINGAKQNVTNRQRSIHVSGSNHASKQWEKDREQCQPFSQWHKEHFPTCNNIHAMDLSSIINDETGQNRILAQGSVRTAWLVQEALSSSNGGSTVIFRTTHAKTGLTWDILKGQRKDAVITEKLSASPNVVDIYGYCGGSTINELGDGGNLKTYLDRINYNITPAQLHSFATDMMRGMRDIHFIDKRNFPTMMQKDVKRDNMVVVNGTVKYHDFNSARFLDWDFTKNISCGWEPSLRCDSRFSRSPEDCKYEEWNLPRDWPREKKDIYTVGAIWFNILTGGYPYDFEQDKKFDSLEQWLKVGRVPTFPKSNSNDPWMFAMRQIIQRALTQDMYERPSAKVLADDLEQQLKSMRMHIK